MNYYVVNVTILDDDVHEEDESVELVFFLYDEYEPSSGRLQPHCKSGRYSTYS